MFRIPAFTYVLAASLAAAPHPASAEPLTSNLITDDIVSSVHKWLDTPVVRISVKAQNERYRNLSQADIDALDQQWRREGTAADQPLIAATLSSPLSNYLTQIQAASEGLFTEIFIVDAKGLNVGQSAITSDYWQGDEAKFTNTFGKSHNTVFIDKAERDDATKTWRAQLNLTLSDGGAPIGAATVEINLTELSRRNGS
ncbi:MAG TPA: hypothetical protein DIW51_00965 [Rhodospirillaceae bacterium]|nr:hypothetical protein [Magnetovibrio sp.]HBT44160.1 hypothetical protein [Rhodospirillaceae bacterium]HCS68519.1 hypothetical protein [Rhodospirillaceae bacterium]|tara:strand:- start:1484 stop:2080 length:597 start_codon:yes stop_codon:yes gene_type:complete